MALAFKGELQKASLDELMTELARWFPNNGEYQICMAELLRRQTQAQIDAAKAQSTAAKAQVDATDAVIATAKATGEIARYTLYVAIFTGLSVFALLITTLIAR